MIERFHRLPSLKTEDIANSTQGHGSGEAEHPHSNPKQNNMASKREKRGKNSTREPQKQAHRTPATAQPASNPASNPMSISENLSVAAALLGVPAVILLLTILGIIIFWPVDLSNNFMALLVLGCSMMGIIFLLMIGFLAACWHRWQTGTLSQAVRFGLWVNGVLLAGMLLLILLMPQLE